MKTFHEGWQVGYNQCTREVLEKIEELLLSPLYVSKDFDKGYVDALNDIKEFLEKENGIR